VEVYEIDTGGTVVEMLGKNMAEVARDRLRKGLENSMMEENGYSLEGSLKMNLVGMHGNSAENL
jgi:hypothetical protein